MLSKTYQVHILFDIGDIVYDINNIHDKKYITNIDIKRGVYICDGSTFSICEQFNYKKVTSIKDLFVNDYVRIKKDPNCYTISELIGGHKVKIYQVHGDDYYLIVNVRYLCDKNYHPFNIDECRINNSKINELP